MIEAWKEIEGFEGRYEVSNLGRVKSLAHYRPITNWRGVVKTAQFEEKILKPAVVAGGYLQVRLYASSGTSKPWLIHRLVAKAFILNPENKKTVNHKDGIKANCVEENLEWATSKENNDHAMKTGLTLPGSNAYKGKVAIGTVHGHLTVVGPLSAKKSVLCRCVCGNEKEVSRFNLGRTVSSCGCAKTDSSKWRSVYHVLNEANG